MHADVQHQELAGAQLRAEVQHAFGAAAAALAAGGVTPVHAGAGRWRPGVEEQAEVPAELQTRSSSRCSCRLGQRLRREQVSLPREAGSQVPSQLPNVRFSWVLLMLGRLLFQQPRQQHLALRSPARCEWV